MAVKTITGMALEGSRASWVELEVASGASPGELKTHVFESLVSEILAGDAETLAAAGASLKETLGPVKGDVAVSLCSDQVLLRVLELPTTDASEIEGMVALQIDKVSPFPVESMVVSHEVLTQSETGTVVAGVAVKRNLVESVGELLKPLDVVPARIDVNSLVWWQLVRQSGEVMEDGRQVFIIFRGPTGEFIIVKDGLPLVFRAFNRDEDQSDADFVAEICDELGYTLMSLELQHGTFSDFSISIWHSGLLSEQALEKPRELSGGNLDVKSMETLPGLAEGVALRSFAGQPVDLTPSDLAAARLQRGFRKKLLKAVAGVGAAWIVSLAVLFGGVYVQKFRLKSIKAKHEAIKQQALEVRELRHKVSAINMYVDRTKSALECLREISLKQPGGIDLTMMNYKKGEALTVSGSSPDAKRVYEFKENIEESAVFGEVALDGPRRIKGKEIFEIEARFAGGEE